jgi:hypothetical protein
VEVEVAGSAAADVGGLIDVGGRVEAGGRVVAGGRVEVGVSALVRVGRVGGVVVSLGDSVSLGAGREPERSVEVRVDEMLPSPVPHPLSRRTRPTTRPARTRAVFNREDILDVASAHHLPTSGGSPGACPGVGGAYSSMGTPSRHHPMQVRTRFLTT